jgi:hypothetical protein
MLFASLLTRLLTWQRCEAMRIWLEDVKVMRTYKKLSTKIFGAIYIVKFLVSLLLTSVRSINVALKHLVDITHSLLFPWSIVGIFQHSTEHRASKLFGRNVLFEFILSKVASLPSQSSKFVSIVPQEHRDKLFERGKRHRFKILKAANYCRQNI